MKLEATLRSIRIDRAPKNNFNFRNIVELTVAFEW